MAEQERIVAVGLLTAQDVAALWPNFARLYPVNETPCFGNLLAATDEADRLMRRDKEDAVR